MTQPQDFTAFQRPIKAEQARLGNRPGATPQQPNTSNAASVARMDEIKAKVMRHMSDGNARELSQIALQTGVELYDVRVACIGLHDTRQLIRTQGSNRTTVAVYQARQ